MKPTVAEANAMIARLVAEGADPARIAGARERRVLAERRVEERKLACELDDLVAAARGGKGKRLSALAVRRIVERLYGAEVLEASSPLRPQPKGRIERISREIAKGGAE